MDYELFRQFNFCDSPQAFLEDGGLDFKLMFVAGVLVMATAATLEIRTQWCDPLRRWCKDLLSPSTGESRLLLFDCGFDPLPFQNEWDKNSLTESVFIGWQVRQTIAAIY